MTALLVIDIGNTNVSLGLFDYPDDGAPGELSQHWRIGTHREQTSDEVALTLTALFQHETRSADEVSDVITLPQLFRNSGYFTAGLGKLFHTGTDDRGKETLFRDDLSFEHFFKAKGREPAIANHKRSQYNKNA